MVSPENAHFSDIIIARKWERTHFPDLTGYLLLNLSEYSLGKCIFSVFPILPEHGYIH